MPPIGRGDPDDAHTYARIKQLWRFSSRCLPPLLRPGVHRYRSIEDRQAARARLTNERMRALRAARTVR
jgi:hypothetical protein